MKKVLIAHQSSIPHYRVDFYTQLAKTTKDNWDFQVVYDRSEQIKRRFFAEPIDVENLNFQLKDTTTAYFKLGKSYAAFQSFILNYKDYDLIIIEQALNNISYPMIQLLRTNKTKVALWGHGRHISATDPGFVKRNLEKLKRRLLHRSDGFFAYTNGVRDYLKSVGYPDEQTFVLNNTIDILSQRTLFRKSVKQKNQLREKYGIQGKKVLLFVGRFNHTKRIEFLVQAMNRLFSQSNDYRLLVVGDGPYNLFDQIEKQDYVRTFGVKTGAELAPIYCISDLFVFPGQVGLGPLQAMCYDLPILTTASTKHMPEFEYLTRYNSVVLPQHTDPDDFASSISQLTLDGTLDSIRVSVWDSIKEYTLEQMAVNMATGIDKLLK